MDALKLDTMNTRVRFLDGGGNASEKYVAVDFKMGDLAVAFTASTPEDALAKLKLISGVFSPKKG